MYHYSGGSSSSYPPSYASNTTLREFDFTASTQDHPYSTSSTQNDPHHDSTRPEDGPLEIMRSYPPFVQPQGHSQMFPLPDVIDPPPSSDSHAPSNYTNPFNLLRPGSPVDVPHLPPHIETAFSRHPAWGSLPQQTQYPYDRSRVTLAGWEVEIDPSTVSFAQGYGNYDAVPSVLPPRPVPLNSRFPGEVEKGKSAHQGQKGGWGEEFGQEMKRRRLEATKLEVEGDIALVRETFFFLLSDLDPDDTPQLQTYLTELIHLMSPFGKSLPFTTWAISAPIPADPPSDLSRTPHTSYPTTLSPHSLHPSIHPDSLDSPFPWSTHPPLPSPIIRPPPARW